MSVTSFQLVDNQTLLPADVVSGRIYTSPDQSNGVGTDLSTGIRVVIDYHDLQTTNSPHGAKLQCVVEGRGGFGQYYVLAYQFSEFVRPNLQQKRQLVMDPFLVWRDVGIDNIIYIGGTTVEQVSNQQGILPPIWRVSVNLRDPNEDLISARLSIYGERFNQRVIF